MVCYTPRYSSDVSQEVFKQHIFSLFKAFFLVKEKTNRIHRRASRELGIVGNALKRQLLDVNGKY